MKTSNFDAIIGHRNPRRGSTLVIVIALLGLLSLLGIAFYTLAVQERAASEFFSEAAKAEADPPPNVWDHMLRQVITGPADRPSERGSILRSPTRRHSMVNTMIGTDILPHTGQGIEMAYSGGLPVVAGGLGSELINFVDSPAGRSHTTPPYRERGQEATPSNPPTADVDYTYPDINNLFLAYRGTAIRDNGPGSSPRYVQVPVIIPSFFRPQYMKTSTTNGPSGSNVPTDADWASAFDGTDRTTAKFAPRSFRPNPLHIAGFDSTGTTAVFRYLTDAEAGTLGVTSGGFPFLPPDDLNSGNGTAARGELGIWTGAHPGVYELDADNDGDGIKEGIWLDLHFPVQEDSSGTKYVILHSVTIYDMDGLIDINVHGNLAGLSRTANFVTLANQPSGPTTLFENAFLSRSHLGLGPNEINPQWALRRGIPTGGSFEAQQFAGHFGGAVPANEVEQANMELLWLMAGRGEYNGGTLTNVLPGRWGESERLFNALKPASHVVQDLPRPGRAGNAQNTLTSGNGIRFGGTLTTDGRDGYDDNNDRYEGEADTTQGRLRSYGHPMDFAGTGRTSMGVVGAFGSGQFGVVGNPRVPFLYHDAASTGPERWLGYDGYSYTRNSGSPYLSNPLMTRYIFGQNGVWNNGTGDDLIGGSLALDPLFEDSLETIFDVDFAQRQFDEIFAPKDTLALQIAASQDLNAAEVAATGHRLQHLAPYAFGATSNVKERFTTVTNSLRRFMLRFDPATRPWEFSADTDGADNNNDGFSDGDGLFEFPPAFGTTATTGRPYSATDPFRPQVRRMITVENGENRAAAGQLPLSLNDILDVDRNNQTPQEGTPQFLQYMQRSGLRFRPLVEHPDSVQDTSVLSTPSIPVWSATNPVQFPPKTAAEQEFWARRDRQKLARDIYVLLYTMGGARRNAAGTAIKNYTVVNDPSLLETDTSAAALYTHEQLRQMAQFAVNMVDAMDTDDVITKFEYDKNFGDGWGLDDDPFTTDGFGPDPAATANGLYPEDGLERGVVFGVEAQQLAFSEVQGIRSPDIATGHDATPYDDDGTVRDFMFVELQNMLPMQQRLSTTQTTSAATAIWRLARYDRASASAALGTPAAPDKAVALLNHADNVITGGGRFTVSAASDSGLATSAFFIDTGDASTGSFDGTYELIVPNATGVTLPASLNAAGSADPAYQDPLTDLDLIHTDHSTGHFEAVGGNFLSAVVSYGGNNAFHLPASDILNGDFSSLGEFGFDLVLHRRLNPNLPLLNETDNPWVEVDRIRLTLRNFNLSAGDTANQVYTPAVGPTPGPASPALGHLTQLYSFERVEPLNDGSRQQSPASPVAYRFNTIKGGVACAADDMLGINAANATTPFQLWQAHFDRDFASPGELLNLPIVGPNLLTQRMQRMKYAPFQQGFGDPSTTAPGTADPQLLSGAAAMLLQPDFPDTGTAALDQARDNRWYRLLQFVEVPSRVHRMLGQYITMDRVPGKINLNTLRHWQVYAGLIDNPLFLDADDDGLPGTPQRAITIDRTPPIPTEARDRWVELLAERDGVAQTWAVKNLTTGMPESASLILPGTPAATPFRSPGYRPVGVADNGIDRTIYRRLADDRSDAPPETNRHWLEVASAAQNTTADLSNTVHQHQILSKIINNTTTVSNTFIMYTTAAYFEAIPDSATGLIRVGGRFDLDGDGSPTNDQQRAVFIIDRTEAFRAYDSGTREFDWKRLVKHRATIQ